MVLRGERKGIEKRFFDLCLGVVQDEGLTLYDLEYLPGSGELRVYIMNEEKETTDINDCVKIDKALSPFLEEDWIPENLILQVSSPGLFRSLNSIDHFNRVLGKSIKLALKKRLEDSLLDKGPEVEELSPKLKRERKVIGVLKEVCPNSINVEIEGVCLNVDFNCVKKANLEVNLDKLV